MQTHSLACPFRRLKPPWAIHFAYPELIMKMWGAVGHLRGGKASLGKECDWNGLLTTETAQLGAAAQKAMCKCPCMLRALTMPLSKLDKEAAPGRCNLLPGHTVR